MNNKASSPSINTSNKCSYLFPCFSSSESHLAGEQTAVTQIAKELPVLFLAPRVDQIKVHMRDHQ
jgi:hypothetical protein